MTGMQELDLVSEVLDDVSLELLAQRVASILAGADPVVAETVVATLTSEPEVAAEAVVADAVAAPACSCHDVIPVVVADAVAVSDAPASLSPEDGLDPISPWEATYREQAARISALEERLSGLESDIAKVLIENTDLQYLG